MFIKIYDTAFLGLRLKENNQDEIKIERTCQQLSDLQPLEMDYLQEKTRCALKE